MKSYIIIFFFIFLTACNEYTITNKTNNDIQLVKSGGSVSTISAQSCVRLVEFLIGMGGDFPFSIKDCDTCEEEYMSDHYEIKGSVSTEEGSVPSANEEQKSGEALITVTASNENTDCDGTDNEESEEEQEDSDEDGESQTAETKAKPACRNEEFQLACQDEHGQTVSDQIQCRSGANNSMTIICVGNKGFLVPGLKPFCIKEGEKRQEPICQVESTDGT